MSQETSSARSTNLIPAPGRFREKGRYARTRTALPPTPKGARNIVHGATSLQVRMRGVL